LAQAAIVFFARYPDHRGNVELDWMPFWRTERGTIGVEGEFVILAGERVLEQYCRKNNLEFPTYRTHYGHGPMMGVWTADVNIEGNVYLMQRACVSAELARAMIASLVAALKGESLADHEDWKQRLQWACIGRGWAFPNYRTMSRWHRGWHYTVLTLHNSVVRGKDSRSLDAAEQMVARTMCGYLALPDYDQNRDYAQGQPAFRSATDYKAVDVEPPVRPPVEECRVELVDRRLMQYRLASKAEFGGRTVREEIQRFLRNRNLWDMSGDYVCDYYGAWYERNRHRMLGNKQSLICSYYGLERLSRVQVFKLILAQDSVYIRAMSLEDRLVMNCEMAVENLALVTMMRLAALGALFECFGCGLPAMHCAIAGCGRTGPVFPIDMKQDLSAEHWARFEAADRVSVYESLETSKCWQCRRVLDVSAFTANQKKKGKNAKCMDCVVVVRRDEHEKHDVRRNEEYEQECSRKYTTLEESDE